MMIAFAFETYGWEQISKLCNVESCEELERSVSEECPALNPISAILSFPDFTAFFRHSIDVENLGSPV